jgi:PIN domain nuclease of toxin-antitoxin system
MNLLLDTHVWLWSVLGDERLSTRVARELRSPVNRLWLSPISVWEALLLCERGRFTPAEDVEGWVKMALTAIPFTEAPFTHDVALTTRTIRLAHRDPADRLLVATAKVLGLTLVTADKRLIQARQVPVLANR